jgi:hypothetical protein
MTTASPGPHSLVHWGEFYRKLGIGAIYDFAFTLPESEAGLGRNLCRPAPTGLVLRAGAPRGEGGPGHGAAPRIAQVSARRTDILMAPVEVPISLAVSKIASRLAADPVSMVQ